MSERIALIARIGAAIPSADETTQAVLRDALAALVEDHGIIASTEGRKRKDRERKQSKSSILSTESAERMECVESVAGSPSPLPSSSFPTPHITTSFPPSPPKALSRAKRLQADERFEALWAHYPKRHGGNSKSEALGAWRARLAAGVDPEAMLAGVDRYAAYVRALGREGTEYVKQTKSFLGTGRHWEEPWAAAVVVAGDNSPAARAAVLWARYKSAGLLARPSREVLQSRGEKLVADGLYPDYDTFLAEVKVTKPWEFADARNDNFAIADLAKRLAAA